MPNKPQVWQNLRPLVDDFRSETKGSWGAFVVNQENGKKNHAPINFGGLKISIEEGPGFVSYTFDGDVDENFRHTEVPRIAAATINFNLENVNNFNSVGIREWVYMVREMSTLGALCFKRCSVTMIDQINMVPDSLGNGTVESFFAPYACADHGETNRLIVAAEHQSSIVQNRAPEFSCDQCGQKLDFDALEDAYFMFANNNLSIKAS